MSEIELKPCPFCGGESEFIPNPVPFFAVGCKKCEANTGLSFSKQGAAEKWNRRCSETTVKQYGNNNTHINNVGTLNL